MRFDPWRCPECGQAARGTQETTPGLALLMFDDEGQAEYEGETKMDWNNQTTDVDDRGQVTLECPDWHRWQATAADVPEWKQ